MTTKYKIGDYVYLIDYEVIDKNVVKFRVQRRVVVDAEVTAGASWPQITGTITKDGCHFSVDNLYFADRRELPDLMLVPNKCMDIYNELMIINRRPTYTEMIASLAKD